ncbi:MAG: HAD-IA family hydrolase, partial [Chloroflexota bacterium]|nr:HAD-IA family hydrolase [Chloroflexota bacterium]
WATWSNQGLADMFDVRFLSFEVGRVKPDREMFDHVASALQLPPNRILFIDDNVINVDGAAAAGLAAHRARGVGEARAILTELGVLSSCPARRAEPDYPGRTGRCRLHASAGC